MKGYIEFVSEKFDYRKQKGVGKKYKSIFDIKKGDKVYYYDTNISRILTCTVNDIKRNGYNISLKCVTCSIELWAESKIDTPIENCTVIDNFLGNSVRTIISTSEDILMDYIQVKNKLTMGEFLETLQ